MRRRTVFLITIALAVAYLLMQSRPTKADVAQTKSLFSAGGVYSAAGNVTMSSNLGDIIAGHSVNGSIDVWHGFYPPIPQQLVGVDDQPRVTFVTYLGRTTPNPARASAVIEFGNAVRQSVDISLYDVAGRRVRQLYTGDLHAGVFRMTWDLRSDRGPSVGPGVYFVQLRTRSFHDTSRLVVVR